MNGKATMQALNPLYQGNMGQLTGLSFENIKTINMAYCADICVSTSLARPCQHGGYQHPNNCSRCICPDGFEGQYCDTLAKPTNGKFCLRYVTISRDLSLSVYKLKTMVEFCFVYVYSSFKISFVCMSTDVVQILIVILFSNIKGYSF